MPSAKGGQFAPVPEIEDVLVFERVGEGFSLLGGRGRGAGWAGQVHVGAGESSLMGRAWDVGRTMRQDTGQPRHVAGPYHAPFAAAVPVGHDHVVVFGSTSRIERLDNDLLRAAVTAVDGICGVPTEKLLADELEVVGAVGELMAYRPTSLRETARHVAAVTARALSCEVAAIRLDYGAELLVEGVGLGVEGPVPGPKAGPMLGDAVRAARQQVAQSSTDGPDLFGMNVASRMTVPIASGALVGALAVGHIAERPRGFTSLCQRIGRAIAESADSLLSQAIAREELDARVDRLARVSGTDALTGIANRRAWDEAAATTDDGAGSSVVISSDVEGLKEINDRYGHGTGDAVLVAAARILSRCVRANDLVARVGGDEFAVLVRDATVATAELIVRRIRRAERREAVGESPVRVQLSLGVALVGGGGAEAARAVADQRMYVNKRRRKRSATQPMPATASVGLAQAVERPVSVAGAAAVA